MDSKAGTIREYVYRLHVFVTVQTSGPENMARGTAIAALPEKTTVAHLGKVYFQASAQDIELLAVEQDAPPDSLRAGR